MNSLPEKIEPFCSWECRDTYWLENNRGPWNARLSLRRRREGEYTWIQYCKESLICPNCRKEMEDPCRPGLRPLKNSIEINGDGPRFIVDAAAYFHVIVPAKDEAEAISKANDLICRYGITASDYATQDDEYWEAHRYD